MFAYGSARGEKRLGANAIRSQLEQDWAQSPRTTLKVAWRKEEEAGPICWIAADVLGTAVAPDGDTAIEARSTFVLRKEASGWKIVQMHFSIATA